MAHYRSALDNNTWDGKGTKLGMINTRKACLLAAVLYWGTYHRSLTASSFLPVLFLVNAWPIPGLWLGVVGRLFFVAHEAPPPSVGVIVPSSIPFGIEAASDDMAVFASLIIRLFQLLFFQFKQCFSLIANQSEQCFDLFFQRSEPGHNLRG